MRKGKMCARRRPRNSSIFKRDCRKTLMALERPICELTSMLARADVVVLRYEFEFE